MSILGRAIKRTTESLSRPKAPQTARVVTLGTTKLYAEGEAVGERITIPKLGETVESGIYKRKDRIPPEDLERAYRMDELVFGIINKYITTMLGTGFVITGVSDAEKILVQEWLSSLKLNSILREVIRDLFVFGYSFVEKVYTKGGVKLVRLATIDTKTMDFMRDEFGNIKVDNWGLPIGFEQSLWTSSAVTEGKQDIPIPRENIAFFRLFTTSGAVIGISPLECIYNVVTWRKNVEWAMGEGAFTYAAPPIIVNVGDKEIATPQDMIDNIADDITEVGSQSVFVFPWHVRVERLESSRGMDELSSFADHFAIGICNALMIPPALMGVGSSVSSSRAVAELAAEWERTVEGIQQMLAEQIEDQILRDAKKQLNIKGDPKIDWRSVSPSMALSRSRRRATYARAGLLSWDITAENQIREEENLPLLPGGFTPPLQDKGIDGQVRRMIDDAVDTKLPTPTDNKEEDEE